MLNSTKLFKLLFACLLISYASACNAERSAKRDRVINQEILGQKTAALYDKFGFLKLETDNEYADLAQGERYWLAIDRNHEYLTLRTVNNRVVEIIIHNPDIKSKRGITTGASLNVFLKAYPNAKKLADYRSGIERQLVAYCVENENLEIEFYEDRVYVMRVLDECH